MPQLRKLTVQNCRGIVNGPDLNFGIGGVILCGDNGTGKSSYVDALEKLLTGRCGSIDTGTQGISWARNGKHILARSNPLIELEIEDSAKYYTLSLSPPETPHPENIESFVDAAGQSSFILRRRTLLDFIDAIPSDRWKIIERILNLDQFRNHEKELDGLIVSLSENCTTIEKTISQKEGNIRYLLELSNEVIIDENLCIRKLNERLQGLGFGKIVSLKNSKDLLTLIENELNAFSNIENGQKLLYFEGVLKKHSEYNDIISLFQEYRGKTKALVDEEIKLTGHFYEEVLKTGLQWITEDNRGNCPLCGNKIVFDDVREYVQEQIKEHAEIIRLTIERDNAHSEFFQKLQSYIRYLNSIDENLETVFTSNNDGKFRELHNKIHGIAESHSSPSDLATILAGCVILQECITSPIITDIQKEVNDECSSSPDIERLRQLREIKRAIRMVPTIISDITSEQRKFQSYNTSNTQLTQILTLATQARKNAVQIFMDAISEKADEYYQIIHPNESIGSPDFSIKEYTSASLELKSDFHGIPGDPRGHYSEGHVDSLGLCIFLAIRRFQYQKNKDFAFLVLDDVLHSVDGGHRRQTADMIFENFSDHQIFITTHDPIWFEYLKRASGRHMNKKRLNNYKISSWTLDGGPFFGDHLNDLEWLTSDRCLQASPGDKAIKAGRLLEAMMQDLCENLMINVPYTKNGATTLGPLWTSFKNKAKDKKSFKIVSENCINQIDRTLQLRNWVGAHPNDWASGITDHEAQELCNAVIELHNLVYCENCGNFIKRIKDLGGIWSCKCLELKYLKT